MKLSLSDAFIEWLDSANRAEREIVEAALFGLVEGPTPVGYSLGVDLDRPDAGLLFVHSALAIRFRVSRNDPDLVQVLNVVRIVDA